MKASLEELAVNNYRAFTHGAKQISSVLSRVKETHFHVEALVADVPELNAALQDFVSQAVVLAKEREANATTLKQHGVLVDLLEIPQLMDTCARRGFYDEGLQLEEFAKKLAVMHPDSDVVAAILRDVRLSTKQMLVQLLQLLKTDLALPKCLKVVGHLRRLGAFTEAQLRMHFLQSRNYWLDAQLAAIPQTSAYTYLAKLTDHYRVHMFELITQYRAIFADDSSASTTALPGLAPPVSATAAGSASGDLLNSWVVQKMKSFLSILESVIVHVDDGASLAQIMEQTMYCASSLGRVGVDFGGLLAPLFQRCVLGMLERSLEKAGRDFETAAQSLPPADGAPPAEDAAEDASAADGVLMPPMSIMACLPCAHWTNAVVAGLDNLQACAPLSLSAVVSARLQRAVDELADAADASQHAQQVEPVMADAVVPWVNKALAAIYPGVEPVVWRVAAAVAAAPVPPAEE